MKISLIKPHEKRSVVTSTGPTGAKSHHPNEHTQQNMKNTEVGPTIADERTQDIENHEQTNPVLAPEEPLMERSNYRGAQPLENLLREESKIPRIYTRCPACFNDTLTIKKGHLLCTWHACPDPTLIDATEPQGGIVGGNIRQEQ